MNWLRSFLYAGFLLVTVIPYSFACLLWAPLPLRWRYPLTIGWLRLAIWGARVIVGIRWEVRGRENLPDAPAVVLSKHQSTWETFFLPTYLPRELCYVYKRELHKVPFFGWGIALLRMIAIDRGRGRDAFAQVIEQGRAKLADGRWPVLFPEGTRTPPGQTANYKSGGARLAVAAGVPVIPIAHNAGEVWPRRLMFKKPGVVTVSIGPAIASEGLSPDELNRRVKDWIESEMRVLSPHRYPSDTSSGK